ncbi:phosphotransferase (plasmid) [Bacillus sp. ZJS3]|uniref:phosphotransferase n=1 Tax=Bacillus sp. ZJS3 TaxID=2928154 RepID=UPI001FB3EC75|nr:phosphotransferase [Bacillus sp. ZJS3]UOB81936.1 phosphotransferase [Bacillus sp. ZJS3]
MRDFFYDNGLCMKDDTIEMIEMPLSPTNFYANYRVDINGESRFFFKQAIKKSAQIHFGEEIEIARNLSEQKIAPKLIYFNEEQYTLITEFIKNDEIILSHSNLELIANKLRRFHDTCNSYTKKFYNRKKEFWFTQFEKLPGNIKDDFKCVFEVMTNQNKFYDKNDIVVSHNDFHQSNILVNKNSAYLIDFDQMGRNSKYFDLATLSTSLKLNNSDEHFLLGAYCIDYDYEKFLIQKSICIAQYALAVISLVDNFENINVDPVESNIPFFWEGNSLLDIERSRFKLAYNFLNYYKKIMLQNAYDRLFKFNIAIS